MIQIGTRRVFECTVSLMDKCMNWQGDKTKEQIRYQLLGVRSFAYTLNCNVEVFFHIARVFRRLEKPYDEELFEKLFDLFKGHDPKIGLQRPYSNIFTDRALSNRVFQWNAIQGLIPYNVMGRK